MVVRKDRETGTLPSMGEANIQLCVIIRGADTPLHSMDVNCTNDYIRRLLMRSYDQMTVTTINVVVAIKHLFGN